MTAMALAMARYPISIFPRYKSRAWWICLTMAILLMLSFSGVMVYASGLGGFISETLIGRSGVSDSSLVIGRSGVSGSYLDMAMSGIVGVTGATNVHMDGAGTHATLNGNLATLNGFPRATVWFEWGYDTSYGHISTSQGVTAVGAFSIDIDHFNPGGAVYYRAAVKTDGINYSGADSFVATGGIVSGFNLTQYVVPLAYMAMILLSVVATARKSTLVALIVAAVEIYIGIAFMGVIQEAVNSLF